MGNLTSLHRIAILIPCLNEETAIAGVIRAFREHLPEATIYVFDNLSTDRTHEVARLAGATVIRSPRAGKGYVIRQAFESIEADFYVMVDGDGTYPADRVRSLLAPVLSGHADMAVATRLANFSEGSFRHFHHFGNKLFSRLACAFAGEKVSDILSGYRAFNRDFVKLSSLRSEGFEIETDLTFLAIARGFQIAEVPLPYGARSAGSESKLRTFKDGFLIIRFMMNMIRHHRPLPFFTLAAGLFFVLGILSGWAPINDYIHFSYVYTLPRAVLAASLMILSCVLFGVGLILDSQARSFREQFNALRAIYRENRRARQSSAHSINVQNVI
jgi:glycosyltransferase involved in cell wall biosynthesis